MVSAKIIAGGIVILIVVIIAVVAVFPLGALRLPVQGEGGGTGYGYGTIYATSSPSAANVSVDGVPKGSTPKNITNIVEGRHQVKFTKAGYYDYVTNVTVNEGQTTYVNAVLVPLVTTGSIYATSTPSGANFYVDNILKGQTPITVANVSAGNHQVKFTKAGYQDYVTTVNVVAGQTTNVNAVLVILPGNGSIYATSTPSAASVRLDGVLRGVTPLNITNVPSGNHVLNFSKVNYYDYITNVNVIAGQVVNVHANLVPRNQSDTTPPNITITSPTSGPNYTTSNSTVSLAGTASDNVAVTLVTWVNNRGGNGTASGTTSWVISGIVLQTGTNIITVTARDAAGNTGSDVINVNRVS